MSYLWIRVSSVRQDNLILLHRAHEECIFNYSSCLDVRVMSKLVAWDAISYCINVFTGCKEFIVDLDTIFIKLDTCFIEIHPISIWLSTHSNKNKVKFFFNSQVLFCILNHCTLRKTFNRLKLFNTCFKHKPDTIMFHLSFKEVDGLWIISW